MSVSTDVARQVEIHETTMDEDGTMSMRPVEVLDLPPGGELVLEPGGVHVMLIDADRLEVGESVEVVLTWERYGDMSIDAEVVEPAMTMGGSG